MMMLNESDIKFLANHRQFLSADQKEQYSIVLLDPEVRNKLYALVKLEPAALTEANAAFLRARRSYLTKEQVEKFKDILWEEYPGQNKGMKKGEGKPETVQAKESYKSLQERAAKLGIKAVGVKRDELEKLVAEKDQTNNL